MQGTKYERIVSGRFKIPSDDFNINHDGFAVKQDKTTFSLRNAEADLIKVGDRVIIEGKAYRVSEIDNDDNIVGYRKLTLKVWSGSSVESGLTVSGA